MDIGLLAIHVIVGVLFIGHGAQKLFGLFGGHGLEGTGAFFESIGLRPGKLHAGLAGGAEFFGGALLAIGLFVPFAAAALIATMVAAIVKVHATNGPWATDGGYEYNLVLIAVALVLAGAGAGTYGLDDALGLDLTGSGWALAALGAGLVGAAGALGSGHIAGSGGDEAQPTGA